MRTVRASSLISRILPTVYMTLGVVLVLGLVFICFSVGCNHAKGIKKISLNGVIMVFLGVIIIAISYSATLDALKYTHGSEKATALVTDVEVEFNSDESNDYTYTLSFPYEEQDISVQMHPTHRWNLDEGDHVEVYFYPEELAHTDYPSVVAVDLEKEQAKGNMTVGIISCFIGLFLIFYAKSKENLLSNGFHTSATITQIATKFSRTDSGNEKVEKTLICQGKNPSTGKRQTFQTHGSGLDFLACDEGDIVHVFIHKRNSRFYVINI